MTFYFVNAPFTNNPQSHILDETGDICEHCPVLFETGGICQSPNLKSDMIWGVFTMHQSELKLGDIHGCFKSDLRIVVFVNASQPDLIKIAEYMLVPVDL